MSENDKRIRKHWLIMWALSMVIAITNHLLLVLFDPSLRAVPQLQHWSSAFALVGIIGFSFVTYHCIYKKPGTKLLIFCLILTAANLPINLILYLTGKLNLPAYIPYYTAFLLMTQGTGILWLLVCWRMLKVNRKLQGASKLSA